MNCLESGIEQGAVAIPKECGVFRVALTGGPSGGKTTSQAILSDALENVGFKVFRVPETATMLFTCGISLKDFDREALKSFHLDLLRTMLQIERSIFEVAAFTSRTKGVKCVVLCDRGTMDPSAYISRKDWLEILGELDLTEIEIRDNRYDQVIHFVTAADGAEMFYTLANNSTRTESPELARELDEKVKTAWVGHPSISVIDNSTDFQQKCHRAVGALLDRMGVTDPRAGKNLVKRKFLASSFPTNAEFGEHPYRDFRVEHAYLQESVSTGAQIRLRRRYDGSAACHRNITMRRIVAPGQVIDERRSLSAREFDLLLLQSDKSCARVFKRRRCFIYNNISFKMDQYESPATGLVLLEGYMAKDADYSLHIPAFLRVQREVTGESEYSMYNLAKSNPSPTAALQTPTHSV